MKKLFCLTFFICVFQISFAQDYSDGGITYIPVYGEQPAENNQILRTTAYAIDFNGNYVKVPIKVSVTTTNYSVGSAHQRSNVIAYYQNNGWSGEWVRCYSGGAVSKCSAYGGNELERSFMYKAHISIGWIYFDL